MSLEAINSIAAQVAAATGAPPPAGTPLQPLTPPPAASATTALVTETAPAQVAAATKPVGITLTPEEWTAYSSTQARVAHLEDLERKRLADAQAAEVKALQAKGQIEQAFNLQREQARLEIEAERNKLKATEDRAKRYALDGELARALAVQPLVEGGNEQLSALWRSHFTVEPQGDTYVVRTPDMQPVGQWIAAQLAQPKFSHFLRPQNPNGGTQGGAQGAQGTPTPAAQGAGAVDTSKMNLSEAVLLTVAAREKNGADPRLTPTLGFGLRPVARK
jgi:hypothetical protein